MPLELLFHAETRSLLLVGSGHIQKFLSAEVDNNSAYTVLLLMENRPHSLVNSETKIKVWPDKDRNQV